MDPEYQLDAGTSAIIANLTAVDPMTTVSSVVPFSSLGSSHQAPVVVESTTAGLVSKAVNAMIAPDVVLSSSAAPVDRLASPAVTTTTPPAGAQMFESGSELGRRLEEGLHQVQEGLRRLNQPPTVVVVNPPALPPSVWAPGVDTTTVGSVSAVIFLLLLVGACFLLRRYRPKTWQHCKAVVHRVLKALALPASWAFSKMAEGLRHWHHSTEEGRQPPTVSQV